MSMDDDLQGLESGPTWEEALHKLLKEEGIALHTEVNKPDSMGILDVAADHWGKTISPGVGELVGLSQQWKRKNMAAWNRKRALEVIDGIKGNVEKENQKKELTEIMTGLKR